MTRMLHHRFRVAAVCLALAACSHRPDAATNSAKVAGLELAALKAAASRQQSGFAESRTSLSKSIAATERGATESEQRGAELPMVWRIDLTDTDKAKLRFLGELKSRDAELSKDPYLLVRRPQPPDLGNVVVDPSGLGKAINGVARIAEQPPLSLTEGGGYIFDILSKVELPKQLETKE